MHVPERYRGFFRYLLFSFYAAIWDSATVWVLFTVFEFSIVLSNTAGVIMGFLLHYLLSSRSVFHTQYSLKGFVIYFLTFLIGLVAANYIVWSVFYLAEPGFGHTVAFLFGKGLSNVIPFFLIF